MDKTLADVLLALIAAIPPTLVALAAFIQAKKTHLAVNSRMTELLTLTRESSEAKGVVREKATQQAKENYAQDTKQD